MPSFARLQMADSKHVCQGCGRDIPPKTPYIRLGWVDDHTWDLLVGDRRLTIKEDLLRRLFQIAGRNGWPIDRWHVACWRGESRAARTPTGHSRAVPVP